MPRKILLFPFGGNAREALMTVFEINDRRRIWEPAGFVDDNFFQHGKECCGVPVVGGREQFAEFPDAYVLAVPGSPANYLGRRHIIECLPVDPLRYATIIHPSVSRAPDAVIGHNCIIMANVVISCGVTIGDHCVILPNTVISHDSVVGDYCCIGSNVSVSGTVRIGASCYIGSGTKMREEIEIGAGSLIGLGSTVLADIPAGVIAVGSPAKVIKKYE